ncbi:hypothetical protein KP509_12G096800 [Ceratopteris richardii]|uniref:Uncharacterized protein n=1 Tax=Ceratopteris richardii TaxID=49495 RepID=A0A8T2TR30_CERRI|nr:hypothetical protein KP509_12G096800 [Ceratopteris richardii]
MRTQTEDMNKVRESTDKPITVEEVCLVRPNRASLQHQMYLSATDILMKSSKPPRTILFYPGEEDLNPVDHFATLKRGLSAVLVDYYPFAGRLVIDEESKRLALNCNDAGIELILARCDSVHFSDLTSANYVPRRFFRQLAPMDTFSSSDQVDVPVTAIQLTVFKGGMTVGIAIQHSVADGISVWMFTKALSDACRGQPSTGFGPLHYRCLLKPDTVMLNKFPLKCASPKPDIFPCIDDCDANGTHASGHGKQLFQVVLHFSREMIDTLKKACESPHASSISNPSQTCSFSTYQALSSYLWKRYILAKGFKGGTTVHLSILLDVRNRIVPPLTSAYCGNAIVRMFTISTAYDIATESLGATAARIRQTVRSTDDYWIKKFIMHLENGDLTRLPANVFRIRNAMHFPVYEAGDFGWGQPDRVRPPMSDLESRATWYPCKDSQGIDVLLAFSEKTYSRFFSAELYSQDPLDISKIGTRLSSASP